MSIDGSGQSEMLVLFKGDCSGTEVDGLRHASRREHSQQSIDHLVAGVRSSIERVCQGFSTVSPDLESTLLGRLKLNIFARNR